MENRYEDIQRDKFLFSGFHFDSGDLLKAVIGGSQSDPVHSLGDSVEMIRSISARHTFKMPGTRGQGKAAEK